MMISGPVLFLVSSIFMLISANSENLTVVEYLPDPSLVVPYSPFNKTLHYKGNWCERQQLLSDGIVPLKLALAGETVKVALPYIEDFLNFGDDGNIDASSPGLYINLLDEVARRGNFSWTFGFHEIVSIYQERDSKAYTYSDLLFWLVENFDVAVNWWFGLSSRIKNGVTFPKGFYDGSIIIIARKRTTGEEGFDIFSWSGPFSLEVWLSLIATLVASGIVIYILEEGLSCPKLNELGNFGSIMIEYIYKSFIVAVGHMNLNMKTKPAQAVVLSLSFFAMLMLSSYTANLVGFLVQQNAIEDGFLTVGDITHKRKSMCIENNGAKMEAIRDEYPQAVFVGMRTENDAIRGLINGDCHYAITSVSGWDEFKNRPEVNKGCMLEHVGPVYKNFEAGFAMKSDAGIDCTSLVREVFHVHFLEMHEDGFIRDSWNRHLIERHGSNVCSEITETEDTKTLDLQNMGGIFIFHSAFLIVAVTCAIGGNMYNRFCNRKMNERESKFIKNEDNLSIREEKRSIDDGPNLLVSSENMNRNSFTDSKDMLFLREQVKTLSKKLDEMVFLKSQSSE